VCYKRIAIDGHVIACTSECNDLSEFGYKASKLGTEQINWLTAYDVVDSLPLLSHVYSGADPDKISVKTLFDRYKFSHTEFLVDRGFNTDPDKVSSGLKDMVILPGGAADSGHRLF